MCGCRKKAGLGNRRTAISPTPVQTRFTATPNLTANQLNQKPLTNNIPVNNAPISLNQKVNLNSLNSNRANVLRRSIYEQARIKAIKKQQENNK